MAPVRRRAASRPLGLLLVPSVLAGACAVVGCVREVPDDLSAFASEGEGSGPDDGASGADTGLDDAPGDMGMSSSDDHGDSGRDDGDDRGGRTEGDDASDPDDAGDPEDTDDGAASDAGSDDTGVPCDELVLQLLKPIPDVMLVLDASGSMSTLMAGSDVSRWATLHGVVSPVVQALGWEVAFGLQIFPGGNSCGVPQPALVPTLDGGNALMAALPPPDFAVSGSTPTATALKQSYEVLLADPNVVAPTVILVTDGGVSAACGAPNTQSSLVDIVTEAHDAAVATWIVAIDPSADLVQHLNALAVAGGTAQAGPTQFLEADDATTLAAAISTATQDLIPCEVALPEIPPYPELVELEIDGLAQPLLASCSQDTGFVLTGPSDAPTGIELCAETCGLAKAGGALQVSYGCVPG